MGDWFISIRFETKMYSFIHLSLFYDRDHYTNSCTRQEDGDSQVGD